MSQIKAFLEKAISDESLMVKLNELGVKGLPDEEIIKLATEHGFTITKIEIEEMKNRTVTSDKLNEEELGNIAGGCDCMGTQNRFDPNVCPTLTRTRYECVGLFYYVWCDHYKRTHIGKNKSNLYHHLCRMGAFDYQGTDNGNPV